MKNFMKEFREFIAKGDVMSMAVGIIIGGAFTAIVNSLVGDIITPLLGMIIGGIDFTGISVTVGNAKLMVGNFIQAVIVFILTALVIFCIMRSFNKMADRFKKEEEPEAEPEPEKDPSLEILEEIRDLMKEEK